MTILAERWCYRRARLKSVVPTYDGVRDGTAHHFPALAGSVHMIPMGSVPRGSGHETAARGIVSVSGSTLIFTWTRAIASYESLSRALAGGRF